MTEALVHHDHDLTKAQAEVYYVSAIQPPQQTKHFMVVLADDFPMTEVFLNASKIIQAPSPGPPYTSTTALLPKTPRLAALAADGIKLNAVRVAPVCSPTRASIWTGVYPFRHGVTDVVNRGTSQASADFAEYGDPGYLWPSIFHALADVGVKTAFIGKIHQSVPYDEEIVPQPGRFGQGWNILEKIVRTGQVGNATRICTTLRNLNQTSGPIGPPPEDGSYYHYAVNESGENGQETVIIGQYNTSFFVDKAIEWWNTIGVDDRAFMYLAFNGTHTPLGGNPPHTKRDFPPDDLVETQEYKDLRDLEADPNQDGNESDASLDSFWEDQEAAAEAIDEELGRLIDGIPPDVRKNLTILFLCDNGHDSITLPAAISRWGKDYGTAWNNIITTGKLKGAQYRFGTKSEAIWSGPGQFSFVNPHRGETLEWSIDAVDITRAIAEYFGITWTASDAVEILPYLITSQTTTPLTHARQDSWSEKSNPCGDWRDKLTTANGTTIILEQSMQSWLRSSDGFDPAGKFVLIRKRGANGVADDQWHYELYWHFEEDLTPVDEFEQDDLYGDSRFDDHAIEIEARMEALLNSSIGEGGNAIAVKLADGTYAYVKTVEISGEDRIPVKLADGSFAYIRPTQTGVIGVPVANSGGRVIPYVELTDEGTWQMPVTLFFPPAIGFIRLDPDDNLPVANSGGRHIASVPGSPRTIPVANSGGRSINLEQSP